ncbi:MAG: hypothetical protein M3N43_12195, partial [Actinomycetota bacterium]|nr:hypothetical protein [Actinomycetota bacterium]
MASPSSAQPACTISWDGGGGTNAWHEAANWDRAGADSLPGPSDHVCIPASVTVEFSQDTVSVLTVQSQGTLVISGGALNLTDIDPIEGSITANLTQSGGTLGGVDTLTVSGTF